VLNSGCRPRSLVMLKAEVEEEKRRKRAKERTQEALEFMFDIFFINFIYLYIKYETKACCCKIDFEGF
jgi:hypothetical protein